ncbi:MAG: hypothetical protein MJK04_19495 [Psychrosphaera sp.]|nr:hypothetical protein [Psychrosphaera sp.]
MKNKIFVAVSLAAALSTSFTAVARDRIEVKFAQDMGNSCEIVTLSFTPADKTSPTCEYDFANSDPWGGKSAPESGETRKFNCPSGDYVTDVYDDGSYIKIKLAGSGCGSYKNIEGFRVVDDRKRDRVWKADSFIHVSNMDSDYVERNSIIKVSTLGRRIYNKTVKDANGDKGSVYAGFDVLKNF